MAGQNTRALGMIGGSLALSLFIVTGFALMGTAGIAYAGNDGDSSENLRTVEWIAFCSEEGVSPEEVFPPIAGEKDGSNDPLSVHWKTSAPVDVIVVKSGMMNSVNDPMIETFHIDDVTSGTVVVGSGTEVDGQLPSNELPCGGLNPAEGGTQYHWANTWFCLDEDQCLT